jgi:cytochrome bd-type quinol oxidase subunit 2
MLFRFTKANDHDFFQKSIKANIKGLVFLEFFINLYGFNIWIELILVLIYALIGGMLAISDTDKKYEAVKKLLIHFLSAMGLFFIVYAVYMAIKDFSNFASYENLVSFYLPIILSLSFLPFVYFAALFAGYETLFTRLGFFVSDISVLRYAKLKTIFAFHINLWQLNRWSQHINTSWRFKSKQEVEDAIIGFKNSTVK